MKITATITRVLPEASGMSKSGKAWRRQECVAEYEGGQYPKAVLFSVLGENIDRLGLEAGAEYELDLDFTVREYNGRHYMQASCWRAERRDAPAAQPQPQAPQPLPPPASPPPAADDNLPF